MAKKQSKPKKRCRTCKGTGPVGGGIYPKVPCCCVALNIQPMEQLFEVIRSSKNPVARLGAVRQIVVALSIGPNAITPETASLGVPEILEEMASTFRTRNAQYGDNWRMVGKIMAVLFPNGVQLLKAEDYDVWHLFELKIVKLTRFAIGKLEHIDSIHDDAVYSAMIEGILKERQQRK